MNFGKILLVLFAALLVVGGGYVLTLFSPSPVTEDPFLYVGTDKENEAIQLESEKLEKEFELKAAKGGVDEKTVELLRKAVKMQEVYIDRAVTRDRAPSERLMKLKTRLQNIEAKPLSEIVESLSQRADEAALAEKTLEAERLYAEAYAIQNKINIEYSLSAYKDVHRALKFDALAKTMKARPIYMKSVEAEKKARAAIEASDWGTAKAEFEKAIGFLSKINSDFPNSIYTDFSRIQALDSELASLNSAPLYEKLTACLKKAEEAKAKNDYPTAAEAYGDAIEYQRNINKHYSKSRHASEEFLADLDKKRINAVSWEYADSINTYAARLFDAVKKCDTTLIAEISTNLLNKAEQFKNDYPRSTLIDHDIVLKLRYINYMVRDIPAVQEMVLKNLVDIGGKKMLKTEVTQKLYSLVMKENPSRYDGENNPVDSVSFDDVVRFCARLSWVLSAEVSLPTEADFIASAGSLRYADLNEISWNNRNSGNRTHPVATKKMNEKGFYDLLGNVEEFVQKKEGVDGVPVMGGSAQSSTDSILDFAKKTVDEKTRSRVLGFRIIVK